MQESRLELYKSEDGNFQMEVRIQEETVWATQRQLAQLFSTTSQNITIHLKRIFQEGELEESSTCKEYLQVQKEGKRTVKRKQLFYNLDAILSVGYRVNSIRGTQFRIWATQRLKDYLVQGYAINEKRLVQKEMQDQHLNPHYSSGSAASRMNLCCHMGSNAGNPYLEIPNYGECNEPEIVGIT